MNKLIVSKKWNLIYLIASILFFLLVGVLQFFDDFVDYIVLKEFMNFSSHLILISLAIF